MAANHSFDPDIGIYGPGVTTDFVLGLGYHQAIFRYRAGRIGETRQQIERFANEIVPRI